MDTWWRALTFTLGYNTSLVTLGAMLLAAGAGMIGTFVLLRKRALVSDAISHATLPGLTLAFIIIGLLQGDGRWLPGLLIGAALSAALGLWLVQVISARTRLGEDAAIGAVLSSFFAFGVVLITVIQSMNVTGQSGLTGYLVGATAGMLSSEAKLIALCSLGVLAAVFVMRREFLLVCFDADFARTQGINTWRVDLALLMLLMAVVVIGLKVTGLILIVALTIIPPVAARFWTDHPMAMVALAAFLGALSGYFGVTLSSVGEGLPTGPLIVLAAFVLFLGSFLFSPRRGVLASLLAHQRFRRRVHLRQGLLSLSRDEPIFDGLTLTLLKRAGYIRRDGVATAAGQAAARDAEHEERLWALYRERYPDDALHREHAGLTPIAQVLSPDAVMTLETQLLLRTEARP
ncbi:metal ABC transporter permease [Halomonas urumqiensis]|uniref:Zinc ABC transporter permease n=1 Tax=Halomonas urumqiensis TaxID=1684789 RepID=A0A2N7UQT3_9GAMM|nr:metal ABC transporter permease [Halomonas urumqiensis]PMR82789.1 zinc ABC transporter permease [Halomonas urumqiensis]PTB01892.1 metal ABC transporter permease [Halomonas urumqiensis]GHE21997.1 manganese ABC transporter permease [Halomonas urumqiensis]